MSVTPSDAEFAAEYQRIGFRVGERWPAPPCESTRSEALALLRRVPSGAGLSGWIKVLEEHAAPPAA